MPIEYKSYGCKHKCGYRHNTDKQKIERHESECWKAIENKTCETCSSNISHYDYCDHPEISGGHTERWFVRACKLPEGEDLIEEKYDDLKMATSIWVKPIVNCPFHIPKDGKTL